MTVKEIHTALENGQIVHWENSLYRVYLTPVRRSFQEHDLNHPTHLNGKMIEIICTDNHFGGLADIDELNACYLAS